MALMEFGNTYFGGEPIGRAEIEVRVGKLKNGKVTDVVPEDWRSDVIDLLYNGKGKKNQC